MNIWYLSNHICQIVAKMSAVQEISSFSMSLQCVWVWHVLYDWLDHKRSQWVTELLSFFLFNLSHCAWERMYSYTCGDCTYVCMHVCMHVCVYMYLCMCVSIYEVLLLISPLFIIISTSLLLSQSPLFYLNCTTTSIEGVLSCKLDLVYIINFYLSYFYVDFSPADNRSHFFPWFSQGHFGCRQDRVREDLGLCDSDDRETLFREMECRWWLGSSYYYSHSRTSIAGDHLIC